MILLQFQIQVLQAAGLVGKEEEQIAPVPARPGVDVGVVGELHVPAKAPDTAQALGWQHLLEEA